MNLFNILVLVAFVTIATEIYLINKHNEKKK